MTEPTKGWSCPDCGRDLDVYFTSAYRGEGRTGEAVGIIAKNHIQCGWCLWWWPVNVYGRVCRPPDFDQFVLKQNREEA